MTLFASLNNLPTKFRNVLMVTACDVPPSPLLDSKESNYVKSGIKWDLVPLPTSNTKGGERGVLKALGLDYEERQAT